jgi:hypothetical protein
MPGISLDDYGDPNFEPTATLLEGEFPYRQVRSAVVNTDDPTMPSSTQAIRLLISFGHLIPGVFRFLRFVFNGH